MTLVLPDTGRGPDALLLGQNNYGGKQESLDEGLDGTVYVVRLYEPLPDDEAYCVGFHLNPMHGRWLEHIAQRLRCRFVFSNVSTKPYTGNRNRNFGRVLSHVASALISGEMRGEVLWLCEVPWNDQATGVRITVKIARRNESGTATYSGNVRTQGPIRSVFTAANSLGTAWGSTVEDPGFRFVPVVECGDETVDRQLAEAIALDALAFYLRESLAQVRR